MNKTTIMAIVVVLIIIVGGYVIYAHKGNMMRYQQPTGQVMHPTMQPSEVMEKSGNQTMMKHDASASADAAMMMKGANGSFLVDSKGMTLYTYDKDTKGVSNCEGECLAAWPAFTAAGSQAMQMQSQMSVITRSDGTKQYAWNDMPLYYYQGDKKAGDTTGDGIGGIWHIVKQ